MWITYIRNMVTKNQQCQTFTSTYIFKQSTFKLLNLNRLPVGCEIKSYSYFILYQNYDVYVNS